MPKSLTLLSWNIYMLPKLVLRAGKLQRAHGIVKALKNFPSDIIVFQEAFLPEARKVIENGLAAVFPFQYGPANNTWHIKSSSGVWVLSKIALQIVETVRFKHCADADRFVRKGAMLLSGVADGKQFQLVAAHCQANDDRRWERSTQMQQLRDELIFPFQSESIPQFICADMNVPVQKLGEYDLMLELLDATDTPLSGPTRFTYDGFHNTIVQSLGYRSEHTTYDYILLRENKAGIKNIRKSIQVFRHEGKDLSDHYALLCEIDW